jgi:Cdc6-like AAA superfamily ATPase
MTSTEAVKREIERFLRSPAPEVLCITGSWGVGKTYTWRTILDRVRSKRETGLSRYSYVSLFGIDSLEGMKTAIFENLEFLLPEGSTGLERILSGGNTALKGGKKLASVLSALPVPYVGGALSKAQPLLFSAIRNQIVCVDDLERRGSISVKDVFGMIS